jgi:serine/threonine-protein kinase
LLEVLGRGGTATVWLGDDLRIRRHVAVKVLDPAVVADPGVPRRLGREARTLSLLVHPNIVAVHDFDVDDGTAYLVMDLVDGPSLATALAEGALPARQAVDVAVQVCDALAAAHSAGVRHGDLKPSNLIVAPDGTVKVSDFGLAAGGATGTGSDLYALGRLLDAMLTGVPPVPPADLPGDVPAELDVLIDDLVTGDPDDRPEPVAAVRARLAGIADRLDLAAEETAAFSPTTELPELAATDEPATGEPAAPHAPGHRRPSRWARLAGSRMRWGLAAALVVVLLGVAYAAMPAPVGAPDAAQWSGVTTPSAATQSDDAAPSTVDGVPPASGRPSPRRSVPASRGPTAADQVAALQALVTQQANAGHLDAEAASELHGSLDDIARRLGRGQTFPVTSRVSQLRGRLTELKQDGQLTSAGYQVLAAGVDQLASTLAHAP